MASESKSQAIDTSAENVLHVSAQLTKRSMAGYGRLLEKLMAERDALQLKVAQQDAEIAKRAAIQRNHEDGIVALREQVTALQAEIEELKKVAIRLSAPSPTRFWYRP